MKSKDQTVASLTALAKLLPGDVIHDVAPTSKMKAPTKVVLSNLDAARAKRNRKALKRMGNK